MRLRIPVRCERCRRRWWFAHFLVGLFGGCSACNGYGWLWSDGVRPRPCPGGGRMLKDGVNPFTGKRATDWPCGRTFARCPGCDREMGGAT